MSNGLLGGMALSQHIPTPQEHANRIPLLIDLPKDVVVTIGDLSGCGAGNLLAPFATNAAAKLFGIEISAERAELAQRRLPNATIVRSPFEAVRPTAEAFSLCVTNPPYTRLDDGRRAEYAAQTLVTRALLPGGVNIAIIPARSGLDGTLINHWARHYEDVRCWRFPDGEADDDRAFQKYSQIVLAGVKRSITLDEPDGAVKATLQGWRYDSEKSSWAGGTPPPILPDARITNPYLLPAINELPELTVLHADEDVLLRGLEAGGIHHTAAWREAVTHVPEGLFARPLMPPTGPAHLAALILSGLLNGDILTGPNGEPFLITTATSKQATKMPIEDDLRQKNVVAVSQIEDNPVLGVLNLETGAVEYFQNDAAFAFLQPLLPTLAGQVLAKHTPLYQLNPKDWEIRVVAQIGLDKQLPGAEFPGLAPAQMHRVFALRRALWENSCAMMQGEPGVGKTRQLIALIATLAHYWQERSTEFRSVRQPDWARKLKKAWKANPHTYGCAPKALPVWIAPPKRVIPTWRRELAGAFPDAEFIVIRDHTDINRWMARCTQSDAPVVVACISHSTKAATGIRWVPAVLERERRMPTPDLFPPEEMLAELEQITDTRSRSPVAYRNRTTGDILMTEVTQRTFFCPDCQTQVEAVPRNKKKSDEDEDAPEPVTSRTYFEKKRRWCFSCGAALWTIAKTEARERKYPTTSFATWAQHSDQWIAKTQETLGRIMPNGAVGPQCPDSFSPYQYFYRKYRGCAALAIIDESHNGRSETTDVAQAHHFMMLSSQCRILASGTHTGGELRHLYHYVFRYNPQFWLRLGFSWNDVDAAVQRYGVVQEHITERESDARRGSGSVDRTTSVVEVPGISATLLPAFLSEMVYIGVLDVGAYMPKLVEIPVLIDMDDPALRERVDLILEKLHAAELALETARDTDADEETIAELVEHISAFKAEAEGAEAWSDARDLARHYHRMTEHLDELSKQRNNAARLAKGSVPRWWSVMPMVEPPFTVFQKLRGPWGDIIGEQCILHAPVLAADHEYPLERKVKEVLTSERRQNRRVMLYVEQNHERVTAKRYAGVLHEFNPWCLPHMDPELREDAIRQAVAEGHTTVIVPYTHVSEGLNLQNEFDSIIWVEMAQSHFLRDQASRRIWRLGKQFAPDIAEEHREVRVYYLVYRGSGAHKKLNKLGQQNGAAILFAGDTPDGALVKQAGANHTALAKMSQHIEADEDEQTEGNLDATFARRNEERHVTLQRGRAWVGVEDTLPERLRAVRAQLEDVATLDLPQPVLKLPTLPSVEPVAVLLRQGQKAAKRAVDMAEIVEQLTLFAPAVVSSTRRVLPDEAPTASFQQLTLW